MDADKFIGSTHHMLYYFQPEDDEMMSDMDKMDVGDYPVLSQRDKRWARLLLGNSRTSTVGTYGCLLSCFAMLAGWDDVGRMNDCRKNNGGFLREPKGAYAANFDIDACAPNVKRCLTSTRWNGIPTPREALDVLLRHLTERGPAIVEVDSIVATRALDQHFVLAVGASGDEITIHDPWYGDAVSLCPRYGPNLAYAVWRYILYEVQS